MPNQEVHKDCRHFHIRNKFWEEWDRIDYQSKLWNTNFEEEEEAEFRYKTMDQNPVGDTDDEDDFI
jgi:hypothetical protein